jgi:hypothetical protein
VWAELYALTRALYYASSRNGGIMESRFMRCSLFSSFIEYSPNDYHVIRLAGIYTEESEEEEEVEGGSN